MNTKHKIQSILIPLAVLLSISLAISACGPGLMFGPTVTPTQTSTPTSTSTSTPLPTATATSTPVPLPPHGTLIPATTNAEIADRSLVLCKQEHAGAIDLTCVLQTTYVTSDASGHFQFGKDLADGSYFLFYDSGWTDFQAGMKQWGGQEIHVGDLKWLVNNFFISKNGQISIVFHSGDKIDSQLAGYRFFFQSPFFWAHLCGTSSCGSIADVQPIVFHVTNGSAEEISVPVYPREKPQ